MRLRPFLFLRGEQRSSETWRCDQLIVAVNFNVVVIFLTHAIVQATGGIGGSSVAARTSRRAKRQGEPASWKGLS
jgi:hypothetical protein